MNFRLLVIIITVAALTGQIAMADVVLRYQARGNRPAQPPQHWQDDRDRQDYAPRDSTRTGEREWWSEPDFYTVPPGAAYFDGYYFYDWQGYPILPAPRVVRPPVAAPPFIARPQSPPPLRIGRRNGETVFEISPRYRRWPIPRYPDYLTSGSAYYPTPTYPLTPRFRLDIGF